MRPAPFVDGLGQGAPVVGEERTEQGQDLRVGLKIKKEGMRQITDVSITGLLITAYFEQGADYMKAVADVLDRLRLVVRTVGLHGEVIHHTLAEAVPFLWSEPP